MTENKVKLTTPKADGYYMPAEFSPHRRTYMIWPERTDNWRLGAKPAQKCFVEVAEAIANFEEVVMLVSAKQYMNARAQLDARVIVVEMSSNDAWARDSGATFLKDSKSELRAVDWQFNAWGGLVDGLYFPWDQDNQIAGKMAQLERCHSYALEHFVLEGGSIHVDGEGTAIVTETCLLSAGRNPELSKAEIEEYLRLYLNVEQVIWLPHGIYQDETNAHVDNICAFIRPGELVLGFPEDSETMQYQYSMADYQLLTQLSDAKGRKLVVHKVPIPTDLYVEKADIDGIDIIKGTIPRRIGDYLGGSYINFYFCNDALILPAFGIELDKIVLKQFEALLPEYQIIQVPSREILLGGGNIHCITQQVPM
ncbi:MULTISPECIES: agmatine deiminase [unclassified Enterococcus]|uniref:agmatine deiminase n=1 Tax=unclassified Enterococcus TaxID=2608891 RepID=UPI001554BD48|nr:MULTISPECIES: agmatine deiminase [unclassified Enterococcus]MBS7576762.1 agmatine deiminase [Enterococcus sp. MMGLQ5-2]MBS7583751.1 agmatine deiminase [Enterococcus sp. MMGLQ5-1]NPD11612.1 agmatine deiminase [Enterococcus sp. MMGLQ5-1]NPD36599.1 agmatine deiminase [Enterococcus sp. MMGLQ5-2]